MDLIKLTKVVCILLLLDFSCSLECSNFRPENIKLITFDVYAALMSTVSSLKTNIREIIPKNITDDKVNDYATCWVKYYGGAMYADVSKYKEPFEDYLKEGLKQCTEKLKMADVVNEETIGKLILSWTKLTPWPETIDTLKKIQAHGIMLGILSNGSHDSLKSLSENSLPGITFKYIFSSTEPKVFKPKSEMYRQVENSKLPLENILHIAGADMDVEGCRNYGLLVGHNQKQSGKIDFPENTKPCFTLENLSQLPKILNLKDKRKLK